MNRACDKKKKPPGNQEKGPIPGAAVSHKSKLDEYRPAYLQYCVDHVQLGIYQIGEDGIINYLNSHAADMLGYAREELLGRSLTDIVPGFDPEKFRRTLAALREKSSRTFRLMHSRKDGSEIPVEVTVNYFQHECRPLSFILVKDITRQQQVEDRLQMSDRVLNYMPDMFCIIGFDGLFRLVNPAWERILGWSSGELISRPFTDFVHPDDRERVRAATERLTKGNEIFRFENRHLCKNGSVKWLSWNAHPFLEEGIYMAVSRDMSEYRKALEDLKESEEKYRLLFDNHSAAKIMVDLDTRKIVEANNAAAELYGWSCSELTGMLIDEVDTSPLTELKKRFENLFVEENYFRELKHRKADGSVFDVEIFGSVIRIGIKCFLHAIVHDITGKKQAERELRLLSRAIEQSPESTLIANSMGTIEYVNPAFTRMTGYLPDEVYGNNPKMLKSGYHKREFYVEMWRTISSGQDWHGEICNKRKDGMLYWEDAIISPIYNSEGKITHYVTVREDITDKKAMIRELVTAKEKAEEGDRLKSAFLANMSHEIRTPMNGIVGFLELMQEPDLDREIRNEYLDIVRQSSERLLGTINDIIEVSKIEAGQVGLHEEELDLNRLLGYYYEFFRPEAERKKLFFSLEKSLPEGVPVRVDRNKLESIITNLIKNALKFTIKGYVIFGAALKDGQLIIQVKDSGRGIPKNRQEAVFERFRQADSKLTRTFEGAGLGLSISRSYARMMGGDIHLESEPGQGSTFWLSIPVGMKTREVEPDGAESGEQVLPEKPDTLILLAEDDDASFQYLKIILSRQHFRLLRARNGEEAVQVARTNPDIRVILMDIKMPLMDGYEATRLIREFNRDIPIIAQTAFALESDQNAILQSGFNDYIAKPIKAAELAVLISKYI
ncbi:MAG: PAS domain S-box protein [Mangrovibacterium sp.]